MSVENDPVSIVLSQSLPLSSADTAESSGLDCPICIMPCELDEEKISDPDEKPIRLKDCKGHFFHISCARMMLEASGKCANCSRFYIFQNGNQPDGTMSVKTYPAGQMPLQGHEQFGTIVISYSFPSGIQGPKHPSPGRSYSGTSRTAYLPDTTEGREVLGLLRQCFDRRHSFTIGTSITTGASNCVIWNGIHHKTNTRGGSTSFGWPDATYFERVKAELKAKGIEAPAPVEDASVSSGGSSSSSSSSKSSSNPLFSFSSSSQPLLESSISSLMELGYDRDTVIRALQATGNNVIDAADRLLLDDL